MPRKVKGNFNAVANIHQKLLAECRKPATHFNSDNAANPAVVAQLLQEGADPETRDTTSQATCLIHATMGGNAEIVKMLLDAGADTLATDKDGVGAVQWAHILARFELKQTIIDETSRRNAAKAAEEEESRRFAHDRAENLRRGLPTEDRIENIARITVRRRQT